MATLGDHLAVAPDGDGSLLLWMLDRTLVAQVRDPAVQHHVPVSRTGTAALLDHLLPWLTVEYPDVRLLVTGHATATEPDAEALALRRAHAVRDYLVARGVAAERLGVLGYGDDQAGYHVTYGGAGRYELSVVG